MDINLLRNAVEIDSLVLTQYKKQAKSINFQYRITTQSIKVIYSIFKILSHNISFLSRKFLLKSVTSARVIVFSRSHIYYKSYNEAKNER